jgi:hypothetical protein
VGRRSRRCEETAGEVRRSGSLGTEGREWRVVPWRRGGGTGGGGGALRVPATRSRPPAERRRPELPLEARSTVGGCGGADVE